MNQRLYIFLNNNFFAKYKSNTYSKYYQLLVVICLTIYQHVFYVKKRFLQREPK